MLRLLDHHNDPHWLELIDLFDEQQEADSDSPGGDRYRCAVCGNLITYASEESDRQGSFVHHFTNPHGMAFTIGCFATAAGISPHGLPTYEHSWFSGYAWNFAHCSQCQSHLGWGFHRGAEQFFGLILDHLVKEASPQQNE